VMAGRAHDTEGIVSLTGEDQVDGMQDGSDGAKSDIVSVMAQVGIAGREFTEAFLNFVARGPDVLASVAECDFIIGSGPRSKRSELKLGETFHHCVEARGGFGMAGSGLVAFGDGVCEEGRHSRCS